VALDAFEQHGGRSALELRRDAGQVVHRIDLGLHADEPPALLQALDDQTEIAQLRPRHHRLPLIGLPPPSIMLPRGSGGRNPMVVSLASHPLPGSLGNQT
jgi:hypothetical protein